MSPPSVQSLDVQARPLPLDQLHHRYANGIRPPLLRRWLQRNRPEMIWVSNLLDRLNGDLLKMGLDRGMLVGHLSILIT